MSEYTIGALSVTNSTPSTTSLNLTNVEFPTGAEVSDDGAGELYATNQSLTR